MRILILVAGMIGVVGAAAAGDPALHEPDGLAGQLVYEARFGGDRGTKMPQSFRLQLAPDWQREAGFAAPLRAEFRTDTRQFLLNGVDLGQALVARQAEEGFGSTLGGWVPMLIVLTAASFIIIDGQDLEDEPEGTGSPNT